VSTQYWVNGDATREKMNLPTERNLVLQKAINAIRPIPEKIYMKREVLISLFIMLLGLALGYIAKITDSISMIGEIGTDLGIWVFIVSLIVAFSHTPVTAAINAPVFFLSMFASYYLYGHLVLGFFPRAYFIGWLVVSLLSPIGGLIVWFSRGKGWIANVCAALPISVLFAWGYPAFYTYRIPLVFDLLYAVVLMIVLTKTWRGKAITFVISCVLAFIIVQSRMLSYLPW